ncbi:MAG: hypothetical protein RID53_33920 [Coleofasciculus sp. B1-GNL1-01]
MNQKLFFQLPNNSNENALGMIFEQNGHLRPIRQSYLAGSDTQGLSLKHEFYQRGFLPSFKPIEVSLSATYSLRESLIERPMAI